MRSESVIGSPSLTFNVLPCVVFPIEHEEQRTRDVFGVHHRASGPTGREREHLRAELQERPDGEQGSGEVAPSRAVDRSGAEHRPGRAFGRLLL